MCVIGTTWMTSIVGLIINDGDVEKMKLSYTYIEMTPTDLTSTPIDVINSMDPPRVLKTHLRFEFLQKKIEEKIRTILVFRNPKDTFLSYYHHYRMCSIVGNFKGSFHEWFELAKVGRIHYGDLEQQAP